MFCYFFIDTSTTLIYTLSLHDALPIYLGQSRYRFADLVEHPAGRTALPQERPVVLDDRFQGFAGDRSLREARLQSSVFHGGAGFLYAVIVSLLGNMQDLKTSHRRND